MQGAAADWLHEPLARQRAETGSALPHRHHLLVERLGAPEGRPDREQAILHFGWGGRVLRPLALAMKAAWRAEQGWPLELEHDNDAVIVALPPEPHPRHDALRGLDVTPLTVNDADEGMNASLRAAFAALPPGTAAAMLLLGDLPDLTEDDLKAVLDAVDLIGDTVVWRGATADGRPGHPVVFAAELFPLFAGLRGDGGGQEVMKGSGPVQRTKLNLVRPGREQR